MDANYGKESIIKNVKIICIVLIVLSSIGLFNTLLGTAVFNYTDWVLNWPKGAGSGGHRILNTFTDTMFQFIPSVLLNVLIIYFAYGTYRIKEKSRSVLSILLLIKILLTIGSLFISGLFVGVFNLAGAFHNGISGLLIFLMGGITLLFTGFMLLYYLFYRYLNKPEIKGVFMQVNLQ